MIASDTSFPQPKQRVADFSGLLKEDHRFSTGSSDSTGDSVNGWFDQLMLQSGIRTAPSVWLGLCLLCGLTLGGLAFVMFEDPIRSGIAMIVGMLLPIATAMLLRSRRQKKIMEQMPAMVEEMARAARSGRNIENSFQMVAADTQSPLGDELRLSARRTEMGLDLASAVKDLPYRTGVTTLTMLSSAIAVHQDTGGDLISVLERMATSVRDRLHYASRLRAATIASRAGATMMVLVPILIIGFYLFRDPDYLDKLLSSFWGRLSLWSAVVLQIVGALIVFRVLQRTARF
ncbi:MAG: type II secretion system F family protein [Planctomycetaceae bacterium]|nr:type II secretion system F family protein [Planctomycetaceae bacterium]